MLHVHAAARHPVRILNTDQVFVCVSDLIAAAGLVGQTGTTLICRKLGLVEWVDFIKPRRNAPVLQGAFGTRGCAHIVFARLDALEHWTRKHPGDDAAMILRAIRLEHASPFGAPDEQNIQA